jgi:sugar (glycoside-pentoside-hexuronide) transporter
VTLERRGTLGCGYGGLGKFMQALKQRQLLGYSIGDLGINLNFQLVGFYLAYFYTDVFGISPKHVAGLFLAARIWDAVNDPIMGYIADHTRSRWGRFRPYLLFGALPLNLALLAVYFTPDLSETGKLVYAYVTYILHGMAFTAIAVPYSSLSAALTQDQQERAVISTYRMAFAVIVASSIVNIAVRPFVDLFATEQQGFACTAAIFATVSTALLLFAYKESEERVQVPPERYSLRSVVPILFKNDVLLVLSLAMFLNTGVWVINNAVAVYYFKYVVGDVDLVSAFFWFMLPANVVGAIAGPWLTKRFGKKAVFIGGSVIVSVFYGLRHFLPVESLSLLIGASMIGAFGQMLCAITQWGMLPDTVEYGQWKTGIRSEGLPFSFFSFMQQLGMALGGALAAFALSEAGYVANQAQSASALGAIEWLFNIAPALCSALCLLTLFFYRLDGALFERIVLDLRAQDLRKETSS